MIKARCLDRSACPYTSKAANPRVGSSDHRDSAMGSSPAAIDWTSALFTRGKKGGGIDRLSGFSWKSSSSVGNALTFAADNSPHDQERSAPDASTSGGGCSVSSWDRSCSQAKKRSGAATGAVS